MLQQHLSERFSTFPAGTMGCLVALLALTSGSASAAEVTPLVLDERSTSANGPRPNIVVLIADDWSWPHAGILGDPVVQTPNFDRVAQEGVLFENAFVSTPSCTPSRLSILTGQHHWRLREGDSLGGSLREEFDVYTEMLQATGYRIGRYGKGVWPSKHTFRQRDSFGERFRSFEQFLEGRTEGEPFCFWYGGRDPHRPYEYRAGAKSGMDLEQIQVPACLPDNEIVRSDVADYLWSVQRWDREVGEILAQLEAIGELENTLVVVSSDNGMPFPRCKATLFDQGTRVPLAVRWGNRIQAGRNVEDLVSLCDLAPTILEAVGLTPPKSMTGRSWMPLLLSERSGQLDETRTFVLTGVEKHVYAYPRRALRTSDFLYIHNFQPDSWRTGEVDGEEPEYDFAEAPWPTEPGAFSFAIDPSPSKQFLRLQRRDPVVTPFAKLSFGRRPPEELYDLRRDPDQLHNVADEPTYERTLRQLRRKLGAELIKSADPRVAVEGYTSQSVEDWPVRISRRLRTESPELTRQALKLLAEQLQKVEDVLPARALAQVRTVPIWLSARYEGVRPTGEYHPGLEWLEQQGRPPELHQCVEFTNVSIFEREIQRMPMMVLHELAHAYHDQVLGFNHAEIKAAYVRAEESGQYDAVLRGNGNIERAYGMNNPREYFAETSEAFFGENDFYPFQRSELVEHDPRMADLLSRLWGAGATQP